ncbi:MAG: hypothetical protein QOD07_2133 [Frankiaceae bacterium]|jgi:hypothetical protein|nr:hypothetical protein [Frankiaceae bacterium]
MPRTGPRPPAQPTARRMALTRVASAMRRAVGLHGSAIENAATAVRSDDRARQQRESAAAVLAPYPDGDVVRGPGAPP